MADLAPGRSANIDFKGHLLRISESTFQRRVKRINAFRQDVNRSEKVDDVMLSSNPPKGTLAFAEAAKI
jgi:hypothetical protein